MAPADRTHAGYRRHAPDAVARLALVRTLRELGLGLDMIRRVVDQELTLSEVAAEHAAALDVQISILRLRRAVLSGTHRAAARRSMTPELPNNPTDDQVGAWVKLAELSLDPDFRASVRRLAEDHVARPARRHPHATTPGHGRRRP